MIFSREPVNSSVISAAWNGLTQPLRLASVFALAVATRISGSERLRDLTVNQLGNGIEAWEKTRFYSRSQHLAFGAGFLIAPFAVVAAIGHATLDGAQVPPPAIKPVPVALTPVA